jgi:hypothetical protein
LLKEKGDLLRFENNHSEKDIEERLAKMNLRTAGNYERPFRVISAAIKVNLRQFENLSH